MRVIYVLMFAFHAIGMSPQVFAVEPATTIKVLSKELNKGVYNDLEYTTQAGEVLSYYVYLPATSKPTEKLPMVLWVHGGGPKAAKPGGYAEARMMMGWNPSYSEEKYPCAIFEPVLTPSLKISCWDGKGWGAGPHTHDLNAPPKGIAAILELLPKLVNELGCDPNRCYVVGVSNGGYAAWDLITYRPDLFAAAIPICGAGDPSKASRFANLPIWAFHGTADRTVPFKGTTTMIEAMEAAGGKPKHTYIEGMGHKCWETAWKTPELAPWLFAQKKAETPVSGAPKESTPNVP